MEDIVTIKDYGQAEYLDGACMQYVVVLGEYPSGHTVAFCETLEVARVIAHALAETVIIQRA